MEEVTREDLQEGQFYIVESNTENSERLELDEPILPHPRISNLKFTLTFNGLIKILKIEEPYISFTNFRLHQKNFDRFENCRFLKPSKEFLKTLQPKKIRDYDEEEEFYG